MKEEHLHIKTSKRRIHDLEAGDRVCILPEWSHHVEPPQPVSPAGLGCSQELCYQFVAVRCSTITASYACDMWQQGYWRN
jgi:hypothetical protein